MVALWSPTGADSNPPSALEKSRLIGVIASSVHSHYDESVVVTVPVELRVTNDSVRYFVRASVNFDHETVSRDEHVNDEAIAERVVSLELYIVLEQSLPNR